jgi:wyosine [tRNA(Phe)-imidazoG37] synthetase (radical SAM superfamily)
MEADAVLPSLDAHDQEGFQTINRPHAAISFENMLEGLITFQREYPGDIWLEIFVLDGINAGESDALAFKHLVEKVEPQKIHLNTAVRPTAETYARRVPPKQMANFCKILGKKAEVIAPFRGTKKHETGKAIEEELLSLLARRPCTLDDISFGLNMNKDELVQYVEALVEKHVIEAVKRGTVVYYQPKKLP